MVYVGYRHFKVIMHNSISLDGSFVGFEYTPEMMGLHYQIAASFCDSIRLTGSNTCAAAIELFGGFNSEVETDFAAPERSEQLSYWAIIDSRAVLHGKLHYFRRSEYCRDVIALVSESTPPEYLDYLHERNYTFYVTGKDKVDLKEALQILADRCNAQTILVDSGCELTNALINQHLIDEISLMVLPVILGKKTRNLFGNVMKPQNLDLIQAQQYPGGFQWLLYRMKTE